MRIAFHQVAVLEDAGLSLLAVDVDELRLAGGGAAGRPLGGCQEVRASPSGEGGGPHLADHALRPSVLEGGGEGFVGAVAKRVGDVARVGQTAPRQENTTLGFGELDAGVEVARGDVGG